MVYLFAIAGTVGTVYEEVLIALTHGVFENRSGSIITTVNWVYGMGAVIMFLALQRANRPWQHIAYGALLGGAVEFTLSLIQQYLLGTRSWDYSGKFLNIGGRTTIPYMLVWGLLCMACMCWLFPPALRLVHRIPEHARHTIAVVLAVIMLIDLSLMVPAIVRYGQRAHGVYFDNPYCRWVDRVFDDAFMRSRYPNMQVG
nr:putative ABC transporter permease [Bifidobacterium thermophilum]